MSMNRGVSLNEELADLSGVYLAMWKALESFDSRVDRWSDPVDFGTREQRIQTARDALTRFRGRYIDPHEDELPPGDELTHEVELTREVDLARAANEYERLLGQLADGKDFEAVASTFCNNIRKKGSELADESVSWVQGADRS